MALRCDKRYKFQPSLVNKKILQNVGTSGYFLACTIFRTSFYWREVHIWKTSSYNPKNRENSWPCCSLGHWTLCDAKTKCNNDFKCFYVESSLLSHCKPEKSCQIKKITQFSYFYWNTNEKKAGEKTTLFHDEICHDCDIAWCFWKKCIMGYYSIVVWYSVGQLERLYNVISDNKKT